ncbi:MAG: nuclear transport factor 2 family protein, partial [Acidimicrobiia bacterium]
GPAKPALGEPNDPCELALRMLIARHFAMGRKAMGEKENCDLVERGFEAFNSGDMATLSGLIAEDASQHIPGKSQFAGDYKGRDAMLELYGKLAEATNGTFRAALQKTEADGADTVIATYLGQGQREGKNLNTTNRLEFTIADGRYTKLVDNPDDLAGWDDFWG